MKINHLDFIISTEFLHADTIFITNKTQSHISGSYYKKTTIQKDNMKISVYVINTPTLWLPAFITFTENIKSGVILINKTRAIVER